MHVEKRIVGTSGTMCCPGPSYTSATITSMKKITVSAEKSSTTNTATTGRLAITTRSSRRHHSNTSTCSPVTASRSTVRGRNAARGSATLRTPVVPQRTAYRRSRRRHTSTNMHAHTVRATEYAGLYSSLHTKKTRPSIAAGASAIK